MNELNCPGDLQTISKAPETKLPLNIGQACRVLATTIALTLPTAPDQASAQITPVAPSISASAPVDQRGTTVVSYRDKDGVERKISFLKLSGLPKEQKDDIISQQKRSKQTELDDFELQAANQNNQGRLKIEKQTDEALNQQHALKGLLNELLDAENGVSATPIDKWKMKASTVTAVLENPLARPKNPETVQLLQNLGASLKKGLNPFAYQAPGARAKMIAMIN